MTTSKPPRPTPLSYAVAAAWMWMLLPFVTAGVWTPLARAISEHALARTPTLIFGGGLVGLLALASAWWSVRGAAGVATIGSLVVAALAVPRSGIVLTWLCLVASIGAAVWGARRLSARLSIGSSLVGGRAGIVAWALLAALLGFGQADRVGSNLADPAFTFGAALPDDPFLSRHACLTAYVHGSILADRGENIYDLSIGADGQPGTPLPPTAAHFAPFALDAYGYPPPFLLLPKLMRLVTEDFVSLRALFALLGVLLMFGAAGALAAHLGGEQGRRIWIFAPLVLMTPAALVSVSVSNFHMMMVALCVLAWVALERSKLAVGGGLLAFTILSKISPGLLGVLLLVQKRFAAAVAVGVAALVLCVLSLPASGMEAWVDFVGYHLPKLSSGEALGFLTLPSNVIFNLAPFGIPFTLTAMGLEGWGWEEARIFGGVYTVVVLGVAILAGLRRGPPGHRAVVWLCVLFLASLRSPYAPLYVLCNLAFVLLLLAGEVRSRAQLGVYLLSWLMVTVPNPAEGFLVALVRQLIIIACVIWLAVRRPAEAEAEQEQEQEPESEGALAGEARS